MNAITPPTMAAIAEAQHAALAARANLDALHKRIEAAQEALNAAQAKRAALVMKLASNGTVTPSEQRAAEEAIRAAETSMMLLKEAAIGATNSVRAADGQVRVAQQAEADRRFTIAKIRRVEAAERLERLGKDYGAAVAEFDAAGAEIEAAWTLGRVPRSEEMASMRDRRLAAVALPVAVQLAIIQTGSAVHYSLATRERTTWQAAT